MECQKALANRFVAKELEIGLARVAGHDRSHSSTTRKVVIEVLIKRNDHGRGLQTVDDCEDVIGVSEGTSLVAKGWSIGVYNLVNGRGKPRGVIEVDPRSYKGRELVEWPDIGVKAEPN